MAKEVATLKFRVWSKKEKRFIYVPEEKVLIGFDDDDRLLLWKFPKQESWELIGKIGEDLELNYYTGVKDVNGKDIYEKDIVIIHAPDGDVKGVVEYCDGCFVINEIDSDESFILCWTDDPIEVIGNIYQDF